MKRRKHWTHPIFASRATEGEFEKLMPRLRSDPTKFHNYFRMGITAFDLLLGLIGDRLGKSSIRTPVGPEQRLAITLAFLASGTPYRRMEYSFRVSHSTISVIVKETCKIIYDVLAPRYLQTPQTPDEWAEVAEGFWQRWNLPNTCGAIDGKHVQIKKPPNSGSNYFNYKGHFSMVLLAICDARYRVVYANFGNYGADSDARILGRCDFLRLLETGGLNLPADQPLPNSERVLPFFFVADAAFPLSQNLMKPVPGQVSPLSRGRRVIENVFGIMATKWRILLKPIETNDDNADFIVKAVTALHNFCIDESAAATMADAGDDNNGAWRVGGQPLESAPVRNGRGNRSKEEAQNMRRELIAYFSGEGAVEWQDEYL
ncbi:nuclease HARBI1-like protein [Aphelenchoides avenae]|nr:nuclease HARBI1-like protein [Aphelenchus avenae]